MATSCMKDRPRPAWMRSRGAECARTLWLDREACAPVWRTLDDTCRHVMIPSLLFVNTRRSSSGSITGYPTS